MKHFKAIAAMPRPVLLGGLLIVFATLAAYWPVYSAEFIWDDDDYVTHNQTLHDLDGLRQIWFNPAATPQYYPLVHTTFWLEYHLWGLNPLGFHLVNVLLHIVGALLLWRVLAVLKLPGAWLAAAIFALHPVQVESVAWVTERKNVLSTVFYFSAALAYLRFAGPGSEAEADRQRNRFYFFALILFVAALLCKTVTCSLPAALLLVHWWKKGRLQRRDVLPLVPFFLVGIGLGLATAWVEKHHVGAQGAEWSLPFADRILIAGRALCFYAGKLVWPARLVFIYPRWEIAVNLWWQWLFPATVIAAVSGLWLARRHIGRGALVACLFFCGTLLPALGFVNVYPMRFSFVADHFQYLACVGLVALGAVWLKHLPKVITAGLLLILACLTWQQAGTYRTIETLWRTTLSRNPQCWLAHNDLGMVLAARSQLAEAETHYREAIRLKPDEESVHYNYGNLLSRAGRTDEAIAEYQRALQLDPADADVYDNLGVALFQAQRVDEAIAIFREAIRRRPGDVNAHYNLGNALLMEHKLDAAVAEFQSALRLKPDSAEIIDQLRSLGVQTN